MKKTLIIIAVLVVAGAIGAYSLLKTTTANSEAVRIYLPEGSTYPALLDTLRADGIGASTALRLMAKGMKLDERVREGSYVVPPHTSNIALVRKLRNGQQDPIRLTIGKFRLPQDLNSYLGSKLMHNDFNVTIDSFHLVLPDTYEVYWTITPEQFMQRMEREWEAERGKWKEESGNISGCGKELSTFKEVVILASIVEEETNYGPEKPLVASVYLNRLAKGMALQADPTVKYAVGDFSLRRILKSHLTVESPFNTYLHTGLPPAPICLPSKATIHAVLNAPQTDYLYFCASERMDGTHNFATTIGEHSRNAARFHAALDRRGIKK